MEVSLGSRISSWLRFLAGASGKNVVGTVNRFDCGHPCLRLMNWFLLHLRPSAWSLVAMITLLALPYSVWHNQDRFKRSAYIEAQKLRNWVGPSTSIISDKLLMGTPELFFYAQVGVEPFALKEPQSLTPGRWIALDRSEWLAWQEELPKQLPGHLVLKLYMDEAHVFRFPTVRRAIELTTCQTTRWQNAVVSTGDFPPMLRPDPAFLPKNAEGTSLFQEHDVYWPCPRVYLHRAIRLHTEGASCPDRFPVFQPAPAGVRSGYL